MASSAVRSSSLAGDEGINDFSLRSILIAFVGSCLLRFLANVLSPRDRR